MDNVDEHIKELELRLHQFLDMDNVDEHIKELVKAKFLEDGYYYKPELDGSSDDISVLKTDMRSEEHTSELQSRLHLVCRLLLEKKKKCNHPDRSWRFGPYHLAPRRNRQGFPAARPR